MDFQITPTDFTIIILLLLLIGTYLYEIRFELPPHLSKIDQHLIQIYDQLEHLKQQRLRDPKINSKQFQNDQAKLQQKLTQVETQIIEQEALHSDQIEKQREINTWRIEYEQLNHDYQANFK